MTGAVPTIVCVGSHAIALAERVRVLSDESDIVLCEGNTAETLRALFTQGQPIIALCAAGIVIRALAPLLGDKHVEPPVISLSVDGRHVVPLLGGHRGANQLAEMLARHLDGEAAITTASDTILDVALDQPPDGWTLRNQDAAKPMMAALLAGKPVTVWPEKPSWLAPLDLVSVAGADEADLLVDVTDHPQKPVLQPKAVAVGVGCERGAAPEELLTLVASTLKQRNISEAAVACVVSLDLKADEPAVHELARSFGVEARFFDAERLEKERARLVHPSEVVFREVGCHGVAEGAALAAVGPGGRLLVEKQRSARATCALAVAPGPIEVAEVGRPRGRLALVGIGPGDLSTMTPAARALIKSSDEIVGFELYLDLIAPIVGTRKMHPFAIGHERERCLFALELAGRGARVALISSGDIGIYAMGALVMELLEASDDTAQRRIDLVTAPGISAIQALAARIGAPLGHDFCLISLSDLLTPWPAIERRLTAAAEADFVIALYNPISAKRRETFETALRVLKRKRPDETVCVIGRNLGREGETLTTLQLGELGPDDVDMLSVVLIGSSETRLFSLNDRRLVYTPRGYRLG
ncbi:MAG: precorrin-3B C(17)-methyltransferase [Geminicoccaceae bacterium]